MLRIIYFKTHIHHESALHPTPTDPVLVWLGTPVDYSANLQVDRALCDPSMVRFAE